MTAEQWAECDDPAAMIDRMRADASDRKLRLFAVACARLLWDKMPCDLRGAVEAGERCADGVRWEDELQACCTVFYDAVSEYGERTGGNWFADHSTEHQGVYFAAKQAAVSPLGNRTTLARSLISWPHILPLTGGKLPAIARCVFGDPLAAHVIDHGWRSSAAIGLARSMYDARDFAAMPVLADALQESGCDSPAVLDHCRGGVHVRGCWVVDTLLGKE